MLNKINGSPAPVPDKDSVMRQLMPYMALGSQLAASVLVMGAIGWYADDVLETTPWMLVVGLMLGSIGGIVHFLRSVQTLSKK